MADFVDVKYVHMLSGRLNRFHIKTNNPFKAQMRCPLCGDSKKSKSKARGWLLEGNRDSSIHYYCFNCGASHSFQNFLKNQDTLLYNDYISEKYLDKSKNTEVAKPIPNAKPNFSSKDHLKTLKKISSLKANHPVKQYIQSRQIPSNQHYRIFYTPKFNKWINSIVPNKLETTYDEPRLVLPLINKDGTIFGVSGRSFKKTGLRYMTIMFDDCPKIFGLDKVNFSEHYYVVEGPIDSFFLPNSVAMVGADIGGLEQDENAVYVFDNEPRNTEIHKRMEKLIKNGKKVCVWPSHIGEKDLNDMYLSGYRNLEDIIDLNSYSGLEASLKLTEWKKV